jgi:hypothetical protein
MCERLFRDTRLRVSTENVGFAKHPEGLELVRIGEPMRPEFAAWRYGDQFGRRRKRAIVFGVLGASVFLGLNVAWSSTRTRAKLRPDDGRIIKLKKDDLPHTRLRPSEDGDGFRISILKGKKQEWFEGTEAERFAAQIVPRMNLAGGNKKTVQSAVEAIEYHGHPDDFLADVVTGDRYQGKKGVPGYIEKMPAPTKLALEMALHEEDERRALEGELWRLERAWEEAEVIAGISDSLLLPTGTDDFLEKHRGGSPAEESPSEEGPTED